MNQDSWINRNVARLLPKSSKEKEAEALVETARAAPKNIANGSASAEASAAPSKAAGAQRPTRDRLNATLRQGDEALSPRVLRRILQELHAVIDDRVSEVEGGRRATELAAWYTGATPRGGGICGC